MPKFNLVHDFDNLLSSKILTEGVQFTERIFRRDPGLSLILKIQI